VIYGKKSNGDPQFIPIRSSTNGPMCTTLTGGGTFPQAVGLKISEGFKGKTKNRLSFTVDDPEERKSLERIQRDVLAYAVNIVEQLYPGYQFQNFSTLVAPPMGEVRSKKDGAGEWPQLASANANPEDLFSANYNQPPLLQIISEKTSKAVTNLPDILDQQWKSMTIEWQFLVVSWKEDPKTKIKAPCISIARRLRGHMYIAVDETRHHLVFPEEEAGHATECKRKHTIVEPISKFSLINQARIFEVKQKDQTQTARVEHMEGGNLLIKLTEGGTIPNFFLEPNQQDKLVLSVCIDGANDEAGLDRLSKELQTIVLLRRDEYAKKSTLTDDTLKQCVKPILNPTTPAAEAGGFSRSFACIIENDKLGSACRIVDSFGQSILDPEKLRGKKWDEYWFTIRSTYVKKVAQLYEIGFSKRFVYMKLQPDTNDFVIKDERTFASSSSNDAPPPLEQASSEPSAKRARAS